MKKIGVFDSGVGGLTYLFEIMKKHHFHYVYVADQLHAPYGEKTNTQLLQYVTHIVSFLHAQNCEVIIVACNTICATVLPMLKKQFPMLQFIDVITPTIQKINESDFENLLLIATQATVNSNVYLENNQKKMQVLATPLLVPMIESLNEEETEKILDRYLKPYIGNIDCIVLGCTHYPLLASMIHKKYGIATLHSIEEVGNALPTVDFECFVEIYTTKDTQFLQNQILKLFKKHCEVKLLRGYYENINHVR